MFGLHSVIDSKALITKPWLIATNMTKLHQALDNKTCNHDHEVTPHRACAGKDTKPTENYTYQLTDKIHDIYKYLVEVCESGVGGNRSRKGDTPSRTVSAKPKSYALPAYPFIPKHKHVNNVLNSPQPTVHQTTVNNCPEDSHPSSRHRCSMANKQGDNVSGGLGLDDEPYEGSGGMRLITAALPPAPAAAMPPPVKGPEFEGNTILKADNGREYRVFNYIVDTALFGQGSLGFSVAAKPQNACMLVGTIASRSIVDRVNRTLPVEQKLLSEDYIGLVNGMTIGDLPSFQASLRAETVTTLTIMREIPKPGHEADDSTPPPAEFWRGPVAEASDGTAISNIIQAEDVGLPEDAGAFIWSQAPHAAAKSRPRGSASSSAMEEVKMEVKEEVTEDVHNVDLYGCPPEFDGGLYLTVHADDKPKERARAEDSGEGGGYPQQLGSVVRGRCTVRPDCQRPELPDQTQLG